MSSWRATVRVGDVFHDDSLPLAAKASVIARRLKECALVDDYLNDLADELCDAGSADDVDWFDTVWSAVYDWADEQRVWVTTS